MYTLKSSICRAGTYVEYLYSGGVRVRNGICHTNSENVKNALLARGYRLVKEPEQEPAAAAPEEVERPKTPKKKKKGKWVTKTTGDESDT